jgi:hypothetical protein
LRKRKRWKPSICTAIGELLPYGVANKRDIKIPLIYGQSP